jgi:hypothetical protein
MQQSHIFGVSCSRAIAAAKVLRSEHLSCGHALLRQLLHPNWQQYSFWQSINRSDRQPGFAMTLF